MPGLECRMLRESRFPSEENCRLKRIVADLTLGRQYPFFILNIQSFRFCDFQLLGDTTDSF